MQGDEIFKVETRRRIYRLLEERPGVHLRSVARSLGLPLGTTIYHLDYLERHGWVVTRRDGRYKRFFPRGGLGRMEKDYVSAFHHRVPRKIARALLAERGRTQRDLSETLSVSRSTLSFHVNRLQRTGIVECEERWPENRYQLADADLVRRALTILETGAGMRARAGTDRLDGRESGAAPFSSDGRAASTP